MSKTNKSEIYWDQLFSSDPRNAVKFWKIDGFGKYYLQSRIVGML